VSYTEGDGLLGFCVGGFIAAVNVAVVYVVWHFLVKYW
jgi:hypothetical protein